MMCCIVQVLVGMCWFSVNFYRQNQLKNGKAPGIDNGYNDILKKAIGTGFYSLLARAFTVP